MTRIGSTISATLILLLPALWNRFPLMEYDTGGYLARWFEGYLVPGRSTTYGLFLASGWPLDFWPIVLLQALATVWILGLLLQTHRFPVYPLALPAITAALALTTALPWLASVLLTDVFAGLAVLGLHTLIWHGAVLAGNDGLTTMTSGVTAMLATGAMSPMKLTPSRLECRRSGAPAAMDRPPRSPSQAAKAARR